MQEDKTAESTAPTKTKKTKIKEDLSTKKSKEVLHIQTREFVLRLRDYFKKEAENGGPLLPVNQVVNRVADALGIGRATVSRITREKKYGSWPEDGPKTKRNRCPTVVNIDNLDVDSIRNHIQAYYRRNEYPKLRSLVISLGDAGLFKGGTSSLLKILNRIGYVFKRKDKKRCLTEKREVVVARTEFQQEAKKIRDWNNVIFIDETCIKSTMSVADADTSKTDATAKTPVTKSHKLVVCVAGTARGLVKDSLLSFVLEKPDKDKPIIEPEKFNEWFKTLIQNLQTPSVIILDDVSYHNARVDSDPNKTGKPRYVIDDLATRQGHYVLRIPLLHRQFNAMKKLWPKIKDHIAKANTEPYTIEKAMGLIKDAWEQLPMGEWSVAVEKTRNVILGVGDYVAPTTISPAPVHQDYIMRNVSQEMTHNTNMPTYSTHPSNHPYMPPMAPMAPVCTMPPLGIWPGHSVGVNH